MWFGGRTLFVLAAELDVNLWARVKDSDVKNVKPAFRKHQRSKRKKVEKLDWRYIFRLPGLIDI